MLRITLQKSQSYRILVIYPYVRRGQHIKNRPLLIAGEDFDRPLRPVCQGKRQEVSCIVGPLSALSQFIRNCSFVPLSSPSSLCCMKLAKVGKLSSRKSHRQFLNSWAVMPSIRVDAASKKQLPSAVIWRRLSPFALNKLSSLAWWTWDSSLLSFSSYVLALLSCVRLTVPGQSLSIFLPTRFFAFPPVAILMQGMLSQCWRLKRVDRGSSSESQ